MLSFKINEAGNFVVIQRIMGFCSTDTMTVEYTADLTQKRVNVEPWRPTSESDRKWFEDYYRAKFEKFIEAVKNPKKVEVLRPAFHEVFNKAHRSWCEANPDVTREERKAAYAETYERIRPDFVVVKEVVPDEVR